MNSVIEYFNDLEGGICLSINRLSRRAWIRHFFSVISRLGDGSFWASMAVVLLALQGNDALPMVLRMLVTGAAGLLLYRFMKNRLVRQRPYINHGDILCGTAPLDQYSFPSGHTLHATSFAIMLSQFEPLLTPIVVPFAMLVAVSRVILGLHYPSDVVAGAAIGAVLASIGFAGTL
jgi:undecaprenyl-diphosphatase